jgi:hypothetical protein
MVRWIRMRRKTVKVLQRVWKGAFERGALD